MNKHFEKDKLIVEAFLNEAGIKYKSLINPIAEPPDVIAEIEGKNIGLELTGFSNKGNRAFEEGFNFIFQKVEERLTNAGISSLIIRINPDKKNTQKKILRERCTKAIVEACINKYDEIGEKKILIAENPVPEIKEIFTFKIPEKYVKATFNNRQRTFGSLHEEKLKEAIQNKILCLDNSKCNYANEHKSIDAYWLLMTIEGTFYSNYAGVHVNTIAIDLVNSYDRIFVFHLKHKWIEELTTKIDHQII